MAPVSLASRFEQASRDTRDTNDTISLPDPPPGNSVNCVTSVTPSDNAGGDADDDAEERAAIQSSPVVAPNKDRQAELDRLHAMALAGYNQ